MSIHVDSTHYLIILVDLQTIVLKFLFDTTPLTLNIIPGLINLPPVLLKEAAASGLSRLGSCKAVFGSFEVGFDEEGKGIAHFSPQFNQQRILLLGNTLADCLQKFVQANTSKSNDLKGREHGVNDSIECLLLPLLIKIHLEQLLVNFILKGNEFLVYLVELLALYKWLDHCQPLRHVGLQVVLPN